jgi:hypothetical protein
VADFYPTAARQSTLVRVLRPELLGTGTKFPPSISKRYSSTTGATANIYVAHLTPNGASYTGEFERFATAAPLP